MTHDPNRKTGFKPLSLLDFQRRFATEEDCAAYLFKKRWPEGWHCPRCGRVKCYYLKTRRLYECASCGRQVSVTAGAAVAACPVWTYRDITGAGGGKA
ncbi:MAG: transposase [Patescibacteria group bacterium]